MNEEEIKKQVFSILKKIAPDTEPEKLAPGENIRKGLVIDSFDFLRLVTALDKQFGMNTPEADYGRLGTMQELLAYIAEKTK